MLNRVDRLRPDGPSSGAGRQAGTQRIDHLIIAEWVTEGARVLDVGCGDGALLELLKNQCDVNGRGLEISRDGVTKCLSRGLSVIQGDADRDLFDYPDGAFDFAILSQTIQATRAPREVLQNLLRIGQRAVVSFPNFGHWRVRLELLLDGRMPKTGDLPHNWYDTPNIHLCTIRDFKALCDDLGASVERVALLDSRDQLITSRLPTVLHNAVSSSAIFLLKAK